MVDFVLRPVFIAYENFREKRKIEKLRKIALEKQEKEQQIKEERRLRYEAKKQALKDEIESYKDELAREKDNTTLARFIRNLESRIYAQLSRQMVEQLFGETPQKEGKLTLEGNTIEYVVEEEIITLTITDETGSTTTISVPIGNFTF